jgi:hypothetical protein
MSNADPTCYIFPPDGGAAVGPVIICPAATYPVGTYRCIPGQVCPWYVTKGFGERYIYWHLLDAVEMLDVPNVYRLHMLLLGY